MESFTLGLMRGDGAPLYRQLYRHSGPREKRLHGMPH